MTRHQQQATQGEQISMGKRPGVVGALMTRSGQLTTHSSMTADQSTDPATQPTPHPLVETVLAEVAQQVSRVGSGHGRCAEVAMVSDVVYQLDRQWQDAGRIGDFAAYARSELAGARIVTHQFRRAQDVDVVYEHGVYRPPCRSCGPMLEKLGVIPVVDTERMPGPTVPPDSGALGDGRALPETRPTGDMQGLVPPDPADQQALTDEVPVGPDGRPARHPDPRDGRWPELVNDGGPANPGRGTNCADVGLSVLATWYGDPQVAAATGASVTAEPAGTRRQEQWLGASFAPAGRGPAGLEAVADQLRRAGPGFAALIITSWTAAAGGGAHTWNAVNHDGQIIWIDAQSRQVSDAGPIYGSEVDGVWSIVLDADGNPMPADGPQTTAVSTTGATGESAYLDALTESDRATLLAELAAAQVDADAILAELGTIGDRLNTDLGLAGTAALTPLGSEYRVKGAESLARKFSTDFEPKGYTLPEALAEINDVVRFSVRAPETDAYGPAVAGVLDALTAGGHQVTDVKSFWHPGNRFFGLNCTLVTPTGRTYEVQFPTVTSWAIGKQTHGPYEVMRDPARTPADRMHAFLDILTVNKAHDIAGRMPGGMPVLTERYGPPKDTSFAKWIGKQDQAGLRQDYVDWLAADPSRSFRQELAARGLDPSDLPGFDPDAIGSTDADPDLPLPPAVSDGRPDPAAGQRDSGGGRHRADPGGDLGPSDVEVGLPAGRGGVDPVRRPGAPQRTGSGPGDGGVGDAPLHDGAVAERAGADPHLPGGQPIAGGPAADTTSYLDRLSDAERQELEHGVAAAGESAQAIQATLDDVLVGLRMMGDLTGVQELRLLGTKYRVKDPESLARKFVTEHRPVGDDIPAALAVINDVVRFSVQSPVGPAYGAAVDRVLSGLESAHHQVVTGKVFWHLGNRFYGLNVALRSSEGQLYEIQFPTEASWRVGKATHGLDEVLRDRDSHPADRVNAFLDILALNKAAGLADGLPGGLDVLADRFGPAKFHGLAAWLGKLDSGTAPDNTVRQRYGEWLTTTQQTLVDVLTARGLDYTDVPGFGLDRRGDVGGGLGVPVLPAVPPDTSVGPPGERDRPSEPSGPDDGGDLGPTDRQVELPAGRRDSSAVREPGAQQLSRSGPGVGGVGDASLHGGAVAERGGVDPDLPGGQPDLTASLVASDPSSDSVGNLEPIPYLDSLSAGDRELLATALLAARQDADIVLADLVVAAAEAGAEIGLVGPERLTPVGLEHRVKHAESLARKFKVEFEPIGLDLHGALGKVGDLVRFSLLAPERHYGSAVNETLDGLVGRGYEVQQVKSYWNPGNRFYGLNTVLVSPSGRVFEVRFPTKRSWLVGKQTHGWYEVVRDPVRSSESRVEAFLNILIMNKSTGLSSQLPGGLELISETYGSSIQNGFAKWISDSRRRNVASDFAIWLNGQGITFSEFAGRLGLDQVDFVGLADQIAQGRVSADYDIHLLSDVPARGAGWDSGERARAGSRARTGAGRDLGSPDAEVELPSGRSSGVSLFDAGPGADQARRSGDGGVGDASLHGGVVAERGGVDPDLPGGQPDLTGTRPVSGAGRDTGSTTLASANAAGESSTSPEQGGVVDDRGRGQSTDRQTAGQQEPDRDVSVRVRLAGPGGVVDPGAASRDAHRSGELHRGPDGRGDRPAEPAGDGGGRGVRGGASAGPDLGSAGVAGAGPATGVADRAVPVAGGDAPLAGSRPVGPLHLAPLEEVGFQADLEAVLWSGGGFVVGADPSSHPFGGLVNDGGPGRSGRGNNCMDCSLAGLSTFLGRPMVSLPRWPDILPDGAVDRQTGEAAGVGRAEEWLGGEWVGPSADLPGGPQERAVAVARQYAQLQDRVAAAGPGSAALVVADWLSVDERTGQVQVDADGNALADGSHAFLIVYPYGADGPVWWDPQDGQTWPVPPTHIVAATHALWSMDAPAAGGGTNSDSGRSAGADPAAGRDTESDGAARVRVRLAGAGDPESAGTRHRDAGRPGELHHRPGRDGDGARQSAGTGDDRPVRGGASGGADLGSAGVAGDGLAGNRVADGGAGVTDGSSGVVAGADGLSGPRPVGPLHLAPLEEVGFQADL
ncbi:toxin glutamine deamidase domain-containing protein, partial [Micromonospora sp. LOL_014]|uniref:toxin glutamine deamidase domain-containing protein n=1 Tax=Micromonospora sp. LOL_014 TaxID=3345415 RepID=UPI003A8AB132